MSRRAPWLVLLLPIATALFIGCRKTPPPTATAGLPVVPVSLPVQRPVIEYVEYTGRADAVTTVGVKARATGNIVRAPFIEGAEIKANDLLFEIDPKPYEAQLAQAEAQVRVAEAQHVLAQASYNRVKNLTGTVAVSPQEVDQAKAAADAADAQVKAAKATADVYRLNLSYTKVKSPIDGQVGRQYYAVGNLVSQDQTLLTTVVTTDPMYAYFDMDERTLLQIRKAINSGKIQQAKSAGDDLPVLMGLEGEDGFPHRGKVNFVNNVVNPSTGTIAVRGLFDNPKPENGRRLLSPGMFVRIRLPIGQARSAILVVDRAIGSDQGLKYVYVIDAEKKVRYRRVTTGPLEDDGLRVIEEGLKPDETVAVGAIQQLRPGMDVEPEVHPMPTPGAPTAPATPPVPAGPKKK
ncbi:MAG TPA: efflux RND transporter periplasmic adaptor subunit [Gemmataceae bacterium]|jgi:multidrug efflux system membrane fusion protein|nr:efflux RND transporter periplasmic adaptor subunit [Gemmataceae bacterium]